MWRNAKPETTFADRAWMLNAPLHVRLGQLPGDLREEKMSAFKSDFLRIMSERGFIRNLMDETGLDQLFAKETVS
ncbi:MAG: hypothetical protein E5V65_12745, partial [Mesorhizobium sp.]